MKLFYVIASLFFLAFSFRALNVYQDNWLFIGSMFLCLACFVGYLYSKEVNK